jgi:hypothetical protein
MPGISTIRSSLIVAAGLLLGALPLTALDSAYPQSGIPYSGDALRLAIADGMTRAGAAVVSAESDPQEKRH